MLEEALAFLATWDKVPKSQLLEVRLQSDKLLASFGYNHHEQYTATTMCCYDCARLPHGSRASSWHIVQELSRQHEDEKVHHAAEA